MTTHFERGRRSYLVLCVTRGRIIEDGKIFPSCTPVISSSPSVISSTLRYPGVNYTASRLKISMENLHHQVSHFNAISWYNFFFFFLDQHRINKRKLISAPKASREVSNKECVDRCTFGWRLCTCIHLHASRELPSVPQLFVVVFV